ncbi:LytR/AlgR family response regulator transcription factor [Ferruginibacter sp.]
MKLKVIIVDDEPMARNFLERYCEKNGNLLVSGAFEDGVTALDYLQKNEIDILFLDVEMPNVSGFQLLDQLSYMPKVILTTSKTDYAFNAFEYGVTDFLKKPITFSRFQEAITKITESLIEKRLEPVLKIPAINLEEIFIKADGKLTRLNFQEILYIESLGDYVKYFTITKNYVTLSTLKAVEEKMSSTNFMKVHRSYIVNLQKIKDIQDNSLVIEGKVIPISKSFKSEVMSRINVV